MAPGEQVPRMRGSVSGSISRASSTGRRTSDERMEVCRDERRARRTLHACPRMEMGQCLAGTRASSIRNPGASANRPAGELARAVESTLRTGPAGRIACRPLFDCSPPGTSARAELVLPQQASSTKVSTAFRCGGHGALTPSGALTPRGRSNCGSLPQFGVRARRHVADAGEGSSGDLSNQAGAAFAGASEQIDRRGRVFR